MFAEVMARTIEAPLLAGEMVLVSHHEGGHTWGHYLCQSLPRILPFLDSFPSAKIAVPSYCWRESERDLAAHLA